MAPARATPLGLMDLPSEVRLQILHHTERPTHGGDVELWHGRLLGASAWAEHRARCGRAAAADADAPPCRHRHLFPSPLFYANRQLAHEALEAALGASRWRFVGVPDAGREVAPASVFATAPRAALRALRRVDFALADDADFFELARGNAATVAAWDALLETAAVRLDLARVEVALDAGAPYADWIVQPMGPEDLQFVLDAMAALLPALRRLAGARSFTVFLPAFHRLEAMLEKAVMGLDYDSAARGKLPLAERHPDYPRGSDTDEFERGSMGNFGELEESLYRRWERKVGIEGLVDATR